jgi:molybdate transport system substrate-binding protein
MPVCNSVRERHIMLKIGSIYGAALATLSIALCGAPADAAELKVLTAGAFKPVLVELVAPFEKATGHKVTFDNDTAGGLVRRISGGEPFDLVVNTPAGFKNLSEKGKYVEGEPQTLATVGVGVAVKDGAPKPDISTVDSFRKALLDAKSVAIVDPASGGTSGIYLMGLFEKWGIADKIKPKAVLVPGGLVLARVASGEAEIGMQQMSEVLAVKGVTLVGPLPAEIQVNTTYSGAIASSTKEPDAAKALMKMLSGAESAVVVKSKGMTPP